MKRIGNKKSRVGHYFLKNQFISRPELKPVDKETEVVLRFPDVEKLSPPILMLSAVAFKYEKTGRTIFTNVDLSRQPWSPGFAS